MVSPLLNHDSIYGYTAAANGQRSLDSSGQTAGSGAEVSGVSPH